MGKREKKAKSEEEKRKKKSAIEVACSDDDEANEDLSLKIVQKSMQRIVVSDRRDDGVSEGVVNLKEERSKKEKKQRKRSKEIEVPGEAVASDIDMGFRDFCGELFLVDNVQDKENPETNKTAEVSKPVETNSVEVADNVVLRKLLCGPRYFAPPDNSWGACYNCGEEDHSTVNCTSARRKKPCFVCGSFEHNAKQCSKGRDCFICKQQGHRAKDCPDRNNSSKICLKCGDLGHDMFQCRNDYCPDDLKEIQCYVCGRFDHLCYRNYCNPGPRQVSCYRCGLMGHTGVFMLQMWSGRTFARECTSAMKAGKRNREPSTPKQRSFKKNRDNMEVRSVPYDIGKTWKKKKSQIGDFHSASETKYRGGWITEDPEGYYCSRIKANNWRSPATPSNRRSKIHISNGDYTSSSYSFKKPRKINFNNSASNGSTRFYQHRY